MPSQLFGVASIQITLPLAIILALGIPTACSRYPERPDFTFVNGPEPESLDPHTITGQPEMRIVHALFEGLTTRNGRGEIVPGVAQSWKISDDLLTYRFYLRPEARWSDGSPVTAYQFHQAWERALRPSTASLYAEMYYPIAGAEAYNRGQLTDFSSVGVVPIDATTLEIRLHQPCPYFLDLLAFPTLFPVRTDLIEKYPQEWIKPHRLISNGPYRLAGWYLDDRIILERNPHYHTPAHFQRIHALTLTSPTTAFNLFYTGRADLVLDKGLVPTLFIEKIRDKPYFHANPFLATYFYRFNVTRPPLDNPLVRRALALAIDKAHLTRRITRAGETPARSFVPPGIPGYTPYQGPDYNPEQARALLAQAGYPNGQGFPLLTLLYNQSELNENIAVEIQAMWKENLGITVSLKKQEWKVYLASLDQLDYHIARSSWVGDYNDPNTFLDMFVTGRGNNRTGWSHPTYDSLLAQANATADPHRRMELLRQAEKILIEDQMPIVPLYYFVGIALYHPDRLGGFHPNVVDHHPLHELFWLPTHRKP
ncbi:MAG: peptide ABC transporter substrate-binding protein [Verrucomicrobiae bacterium]|nr:peptide ABC transporter substrate-binding protein [Verrucomicrobiae bacterium]